MAGNVRLVDDGQDEARAAALLRDLQPPHEETPAAPPSQPRPMTRSDVIDLMGVVARILGFRLQLLLAFFATSAIGGYAVYKATPMALVAFGLFAGFVFLPILWTAYKRG